jgi:two-component system OmpR family response regulator
MNRQILVVDDDPHIREILVYALENAGLNPFPAKDGLQALQLWQQHPFDLIVLDVHMPHMDGLQLCKEIRKTSSIPILFLSSKDEEIDKVLGLELGGDDYVTKPFSARELIARIHAILKRSCMSTPIHSDTPTSQPLQHGQLLLDVTRHLVQWHTHTIDLTALEFSILQQLLTPPERVFTRDIIMQHSYRMNIHVSDRTIDSHIRHIREKFAQIGCMTIIETVRGIGYRLGTCA